MTRPRILLTRRWPDAVIEHLAGRYAVEVDADDRPLSSSALSEAMRSFDALCPTVSDRIDAAVVGAPSSKVKLIANYGAGCDHIDVEAASRAGIAVSNTPDVLTDATAELAVLLMLMVARRASEGERELRSGEWQGWRPTHMMGASLAGRQLGLVGFGRIAQATAILARKAFGMRIAYHSRSPVGASAALEDATYHPELDQLLAVADVVSLHCPGGEATRHLLDRRRLALLKPTAILVNTARGSVIDEAALAEALAERRFAGAGLDVYEQEPRIDPGLLACSNAVLLPHLGSATLETRTAMGMRVAANLDAFFAGRPLPDRVV